MFCNSNAERIQLCCQLQPSPPLSGNTCLLHVIADVLTKISEGGHRSGETNKSHRDDPNPLKIIFKAYIILY